MHPLKTHSHTLSAVILQSLILVAVLLLATAPARASSISWTNAATSGTWDDTTTSNWKPLQVPVNSDSVFITNAFASDVTVDYAATGFTGANVLTNLTVGNSGGKTNTLQLGSGDTLQVMAPLNTDSVGLIINSGGRVVVGNGANLNQLTTQIRDNVVVNGGVLELAGGTITNRAQFVIRNGLYTQSGGTNKVTYHIYLADTAGQNATMNMSGGLLANANYDFNAHAGNSTLSLSGGEIDVIRDVYLGTTGGTHNWTISGGTLSVAVDNTGDGVGSTTGAGAVTVTQTDGFVHFNALHLNRSATYNLQGGAMANGSGFLDGTFTQSLGTNNFSYDVIIGTAASRTGTYTMASGLFHSRGFDIAKTPDSVGTFTMSGGVFTMSNSTSTADSYFQVGASSGSGSGTLVLKGGTIGGQAFANTGMIVSATGTIRGYGTISVTATPILMTGRVIADGEGVDRTLNLSVFNSVTNPVDNTSNKGWYAINHGKVILPSLAISSGASISTQNWGESTYAVDPTLDLVNSAQLRLNVASSVSGGSITGALLSVDRSDVAAAPSGVDFLSVHEFTTTGVFNVSSYGLTVRFDLAAATTYSNNFQGLSLYRYNGSTWTDVTTSMDRFNDLISANSLSSFGQFAVGVRKGPATLIWDSGGNALTGPLDGAGNWDTNSAKWFNGLIDVTWNNSAANSVIFGTNGVASTVTLTTPITVSNITFGVVSSGAYAVGGSTLTLTGGGTIAVSNGVSGTINSVVAGNGAGFTKTGNGTLILGGANSFSGDTTLSAGTLVVSNQNALQNSTLNDNAGALLLGSGITAFNFGGLAGSQDLALTNADGAPVALSVGANGASTAYSGNLTRGGSLTKTGSGTWTISGSNTYTGATIVNDGVLALAGNSALPTGSAITIAGGALNLGGFSVTTAPVTLSGGTISNGTLISTGDYQMQSGTNAATLAGNVALYKTSSGTVVLNGPGAYTGGTIISNGTLRVNSTLASPTVAVLSGGKLGGNGTLAGAVTISGGGTLSPGNSVGTDTVASLTLDNLSVLDWEFKPTAPYVSDFTIVTDLNGLTINGGGFNLLQEGNTNTTVHFDTPGFYKLIQYSGSIGGSNIAALTVLNQTSGRSYNFGTTTAGGNQYVQLFITGLVGWDGGSTLDANWQSATNWGGDVAPLAYDSLVFDGFNRLTNNNNFAANTHFAGITFTNTAGAFVLQGNAVNLVGALVNKSANTQTIQIPLVLDTADLTVNAANGNIVLSGGLSDSGGSYGLTKIGTNALILSGTASYTGKSYVNAGSLLVNGTLTSAPGAGVFVSAGATIGGTGVISRAVTVASGGIVNPGAPTPQTLTFADSLTLSNSFVYRWDLGASTTDRLDVASLTLAAGASTAWTLALGTDGQPPAEFYGSTAITNVFVLMQATAGTLPTELTNNVVLLPGPWVTNQYTQVYFNPGHTQLLFTGAYLIPEPGVVFMWLAGAVTFGAAWRRRR